MATLRPFLVVGLEDLTAPRSAPLNVAALLVQAPTRVQAAKTAGATDDREVVVFSVSQAWRIGTVHGADGAARSNIRLLS